MTETDQVIQPDPPFDDHEQHEPVFEWDGFNAVWRVYMPSGAVFKADTFKEVFERAGNKWN